MFDPVIALLGLGVGLLIGLTGMGGGAIMTPALILFLGVRPLLAVGTDLVYAAVTKWVGAWQHGRLRNIDYGLSLLLALGSVPAALLGSSLLGFLRQATDIEVDMLILRALGVVLLITALDLLLQPLGALERWNPLRQLLERRPLGEARNRGILIMGGAVVGLLVGITSVGSGSLIAALLVLLFRYPIGRLIGTDVFHGALLVTAAGLSHLGFGHVNLPMVANLLVGSIPGVILGSRLCALIPERLLKTALASVLLFTGARMV